MLVDSEPLSAAVLMEMMREQGLPIDDEIFRAVFLGRSFGTASQKYEQRMGNHFPPNFNMEYRKRLLARMVENLPVMPGIVEVLEALSLPYCVATSSSPERLAVSMRETSLLKFFEGRSFTASQVKHGKPSPDLMLFAAKNMNTAPEHCLVIEDSEMGLRAAVAANMQLWRFTGGTHLKSGDTLPPDLKPERILDSMPALLKAFREIGIAK